MYLFFIVFLLLEILLRIYDPFKFRVKANRIILPGNIQRVITNNINPRLDSVIYNSRNSLGFRGPDTSAGFSNQLSIITVGGSTTACQFLDDKKTWPYRLGEYLKGDFPNLWINNAGLDGHSTFGHQVLLNDYIVKLKPKVVIFLTGVNDIENDGPSFFDKLHVRNSYPDLLNFIYNNSEVVSLIINLARGARAQRLNNTTQEWKRPGSLGELIMSKEQISDRLQKQDKYLQQYALRLSRLADTCIRNNIQPIFLTQPNLYGFGVDSVTGVNLETAKVEENMNGGLLQQLLELYNARVRQVCDEKKVPYIDLATKMPKNSLYYYDQTHYTNEGAEKVAQIVEEKLKEILGRH
ncbi:MAG: SGNH/GDSL hydrolase family protein [Chitinophagaceae bacterium]|nr:SGNH/GDSL hydrolase family protein [Chitinophagaceae bacterium]